MTLLQFTDPIYAPGEIVWIRPNIFMKDDQREYIVMSNSKGMFGGWKAWVVSSDNLTAKPEVFPENYLTRKNPYAPDYVTCGHFMTRTGRALLAIRGGFPGVTS